MVSQQINVKMCKHCYASKLNQTYFINKTAVFTITFKEMVDQDKPAETTNEEKINMARGKSSSMAV